LETTSPDGRVSVNPAALTVVPGFGLWIEKRSELVPPSTVDDGEKDLEMVGGATTVTVAEAVLPVPPSWEVTALVVLFWAPRAVPVTFTENVQTVADATDAPDRLTLCVL
jgi:hypothetical protein